MWQVIHQFVSDPKQAYTTKCLQEQIFSNFQSKYNYKNTLLLLLIFTRVMNKSSVFSDLLPNTFI